MSEKLPCISVIIPVYNTEKYVERCLESVLAQTYQNIEIIIIDNASTGNIKKIYSDYTETYPEKKIKLVSHKENQGLFKARISGIKASTGEYYAFIDSDDTISIDYYRLLVEEAIKTGNEIVAAKTLWELPGEEKYKSNLYISEMLGKLPKETDMLEMMYLNEGKCYSFHLIWNKLFSKTLWEKVSPHFLKINEHIVMLEDYVAMTIYYSYADGFSYVSNAYHFYYKNEDAYTSRHADLEKIKKTIQDLSIVFHTTKLYLGDIGKYEKYKKYHVAFVDRYYRYWNRTINESFLSHNEKKKMFLLLNSFFLIDKSLETEITIDDIYSTSISTKVTLDIECIKKQICDIDVKYVSFDIFDTVLVRNTLEPIDIFEIISISLRKEHDLTIDFSSLRQSSEKKARERKKYLFSNQEEVTLDEIYDEFQAITKLPIDICTGIKNLEINTEIQYSLCRNVGFELYELALQQKKQIIFTSDMYLPLDTITTLLHNAGYTNYFKIFLSSCERVTKASGNIFKIILKELSISPRSILHIGDNLHSDVEMPRKLNIVASHLPSVHSVLTGECSEQVKTNFFLNSFCTDSFFRDSFNLSFIDLRCFVAPIANKLFDNPFVDYHPDTLFDANPNTLGYAALGPHLVDLARWLHNISRQYQTVHFVALDGYLLKQVYEILYPEEKRRTNYLYVSLKSLVPLMIQKSTCFFKLSKVLKFSKVSVQSVLELLKPILRTDIVSKIVTISEDAGMLNHINFSTIDEFNFFLGILSEHAFDDSLIEKYRNNMKKYFEQQIGDKDLTFDVGYSGRTESILSDLLGCTLDACYVHAFPEAHMISKLKGIKIYSFYNETPLIAGPLRELLLSENGPSCIGYEEMDSEIIPVFEHFEKSYPQCIILDRIQQNAILYAQDLVEHFGDDLRTFVVPDTALSLIFENYLRCASPTDRSMFSIFSFEDDINEGVHEMRLPDFWALQMTQNNNSTDFSSKIHGPSWKKGVFYLLYDRKILKEKVKEKYKHKKVVLKLMRLCYAIPRGVYHFLRK